MDRQVYYRISTSLHCTVYYHQNEVTIVVSILELFTLSLVTDFKVKLHSRVCVAFTAVGLERNS